MRFSRDELERVLADAMGWPEVVAVAGPGHYLGGRRAGRGQAIVRFADPETDYLIDFAAAPDDPDACDSGDRRHFSHAVFCLTDKRSGGYHYGYGPNSRYSVDTLRAYGIYRPKRNRYYLCRGNVSFDTSNPSGLLWELRRWHIGIVRDGYNNYAGYWWNGEDDDDAV